MSNINRVVVAGNVTRDPELRFTAGGTAVLGFGIACNESRKNNQTGEWEEYPNFFDITMFGKRAESLSKFIHKGLKVTVAGKLHYSAWEKDGQKRSKVEIVAEEVELPPRQQTTAAAAPMPSQPYQQPAPQQPAPQQPVQQQMAGMPPATYPSYYDDDIPF